MIERDDEDRYVPVMPEQRDLLLRMGLARRLRRYVYNDPDPIAQALVDDLMRDLDAIGFVVTVAFDRCTE